ncbi:HdeD family acid-resistance protein [Leptolyngbya sp. AN03gr2]|uniref:HdeD family acid-resistance protein n=1 Tax=unclassified Leptolyngbya TaxID=2650499 RepID=UPI003D31B06B
MRQNMDPIQLGTRLARNWWTLALRGAIAILFGLAAFFLPNITLTWLVLLFGALALGGGILLIISALRDRLNDANAWLLLIEGIVGIAAGVLVFAYPRITALALLYVIASWAIVTGFFQIVAAVRLRKEIRNDGLLALAGIASIVFGILLLFYPGVGALTLLWFIGAYSLFFGVLMLILGFRLRNWNQLR